MSIQNGTTTNFSNVDMLKIQKAPPHYQSEGETLVINEDVNLSDASFVRDGVDLVLEFDLGGHIIIDDYFSGANAPTLQGSNGSSLPESLVQSFLKSGTTYEVAENYTLNDASPVGAIEEMAGQVTIARVDGSIEVAQLGSSIYQGDIVETDASGAVNIVFVDETSFAVSGNAKLAIDEYVFDPASESGTTNFSVLKGMFVFTSGLIGRDDPDDVMIETPMGSIGIRGTIIAGDVDSGEITVVEGAIVLHDFSGNEITLADQFSTAQFKSQDGTIDDLGQMSAADVASKFDSVSVVAPDLFSSIDDAAKESVQPEETQAERESGVDDTGTQESGNETSGDGGHINMKDAPIAEDGGALAGEDGQPKEGHELSDELMENTETLLMDTGKEEALMGDDGQLDQNELMEILTNTSEAKDAMKAQILESRAEAESEHKLAAKGTLGDHTQAENTAFVVYEEEASEPEIIQLADGETTLIAPHDNVVLVGNDGTNVLADASVTSNNISMHGRQGNDELKLLINNSGQKSAGILDGGIGIDTLTITSVDTFGAVDFSNVAALKNIEQIDMIQSSNHETITLTAEMIFGSVGAGGVLRIDGDSNDTVNVDGGSWSSISTQTIDGEIYDVYDNLGNSTTLLIDQDIATGGNLI